MCTVLEGEVSSLFTGTTSTKIIVDEYTCRNCSTNSVIEGNYCKCTSAESLGNYIRVVIVHVQAETREKDSG